MISLEHTKKVAVFNQLTHISQSEAPGPYNIHFIYIFYV